MPATRYPGQGQQAGSAARNGPVPRPGMPAAPPSPDGPEACRPRHVDVPGSEVSPFDLSHRVPIERLVRDDAHEPQVLLLELLQPLCTIGLHAAVPVTPTMKGLLRRPDLLRRLTGRRTLTSKALRFAELPGDLFRGVPSGNFSTLRPQGRQTLICTRSVNREPTNSAVRIDRVPCNPLALRFVKIKTMLSQGEITWNPQG